MNRSTFRRFDFFDVERISEDVASTLGESPTCAAASGGMLLFGDATGRAVIADRNFKIIRKSVNPCFRKELIGIAYVYDRLNTSRHYIVAIGDDTSPAVLGNPFQDASRIQPAYVIKIYSEDDLSRPLQVLDAHTPLKPASTSAATSGDMGSSSHGSAGARTGAGAGATSLGTTGGDVARVKNFVVLEDGSQIAVGYSTGAILLFSDLAASDGKTANVHQHQYQSSAGSRPSPYRGTSLLANQMQQLYPHVSTSSTLLLPEHVYPVSALHFTELPPTKMIQRRTRLFAVFDDSAPPRKTAASMKAAARNPMEPSFADETEDISDSGVVVFDTSMVIVSTRAGGGGGGGWGGGSHVHSSSSSTAAAAPRQPPRSLDLRGASAFSSTVMTATHELVIGREEAVYTYSIEGIGGALPVTGVKVGVASIDRYILIASGEDKISGVTSKRVQINIYDLKHKLICGTSKKFQLPKSSDRISLLAHDTGVAFVVTSTGALYRFREKETARKLDVLLNNSPPLYPLSIALAAEEQLDATEIVNLYKEYGDHLYHKREFDAATVQYCHTIGFVPPSQIIMKFLDPYRISNLIVYLERLLEKGLAEKDHVTLLLTCFTKTKDEPRLRDLLANLYVAYPPTLPPHLETLRGSADAASVDGHGSSHISNSGTSATLSTAADVGDKRGKGTTQPMGSLGTGSGAAGKIGAVGAVEVVAAARIKGSRNAAGKEGCNVLDAPQAIISLRRAGFLAYALQLAAKYFQHDAYLDIQMSKNPPQYDDVLAYIAYMSFVAPLEEVQKQLLEFGRTLLRVRQKQFTYLVLKLATADYGALLPSEARPNPLQQQQQYSSVGVAAGGFGGAARGGAFGKSASQGAGSGVLVAENPAADLLKALCLLSSSSSMNSGSAHLPEQQAKLVQSVLRAAAERGSRGRSVVISVEQLIPVFNNERECLLTLQEGVVDVLRGQGRYPSPRLTSTMLDLYLNKFAEYRAQLTAIRSKSSPTKKKSATALLYPEMFPTPPVPRGGATAPTAVSEISESGVEEALQSLEASIMSLLDSAHANYDPAHALLLTHAHGFVRGHKFLLEKQQNVELLMHMLLLIEQPSSSALASSTAECKRNEREVLKLLRREGKKDPELYVRVLTHFVKQTMALPSPAAAPAPTSAAAAARSADNNNGRARKKEERSSVDEESGSDDNNSSKGSKEKEDVGDDDADEENDSEEEEEEERELEKWNSVVEVLALLEKEREPVLSTAQVLSILAINPDLPLYVVSGFVGKSIGETAEDIAQLEEQVQLGFVNLAKSVDIEREVAAQQQLQAAAAADGKAGGQEATGGGTGKRTATGRSAKTNNPFGGSSAAEEEEEDEEEEEEGDSDDEYDAAVDQLGIGASAAEGTKGSVGGAAAIPTTPTSAAAAAAKERKKWESIRRAQNECSQDHEAFYKELELNPDGFGTVAAYFGRSIIS